MFTIKSYHFNPINMVCILLLCTIILLLTAFKSNNSVLPVTTEKVMQYPEKEQEQLDFIKMQEYKEYKDYQLSLKRILVNGKYKELVFMYDRSRLAGIITLDNNCNLTKTIYKDNE